MVGRDVTIPVEGGSMDAYLASPEPGSGPHSAIIILPEIYGVNPEMRRVADLVASAGGHGLAINFYHRTDPGMALDYSESSAARGAESAKHVTRATMRADVAAARDWLNEQDFVKRGNVATWGFCIGGAVAFVTATLPGIKGAVSFYGSQIARQWKSGEPEGLTDVNDVSCPLLLVYGKDDQGNQPETIDRVGVALNRAGKSFQIEVYPGVGHAFFRHGTAAAPAHHHHHSDEALAQARADAWHLTLAFFKRLFVQV